MTTFGKNSSIGFIGAGNVGTSLAVALHNKGYNVASVASRTFESALNFSCEIQDCNPERNIQKTVNVSEVVFVTTPDDAIVPTLKDLQFEKGQLVIHCSGVSSLDIFDRVNLPKEVYRACFHPIQAFSSIERDVGYFQDITFGIEGNMVTRDFLVEICKNLNANFVKLRPGDKPLYHLSGVLMGGLLSEYVALCAQLWVSFGLSREEGIKALLPMMKQVSLNVEKHGIPGAVAGPFARGDVGTVTKHIDAILEYRPDLLPFYCHLSLQGLGFVQEKNQLNQGAIDNMKKILKESLRDNPRT